MVAAGVERLDHRHEVVKADDPFELETAALPADLWGKWRGGHPRETPRPLLGEGDAISMAADLHSPQCVGVFGVGSG